VALALLGIQSEQHEVRHYGPIRLMSILDVLDARSGMVGRAGTSSSGWFESSIDGPHTASLSTLVTQHESPC
jgi:hypothetical protein